MIYLKEQRALHPSMQARDALKLCYQAAFGAEHLLSDIGRARAYFDSELQAIEPTDEALFENISDEICRVNLGAWKREGLNPSWLFEMFRLSCSKTADSTKAFAEYAEAAAEEIDDFKLFFDEYLKGGIRPVHHSDSYRTAERPHYRVVRRDIARIIPILAKISYANAKTISIDGRAASGKSTVAGLLSEIIGAEIVHMDHFFLPPELRNDARKNEIGGNIHYERFISDVLPNLISGKEFSYRIFDCSKMDYGETKVVKSAPYIIVEGSYSAHPVFNDYADLRVFSDVSEEEQMKRIIRRNGEEMAEVFASRWIPMEEEYHSHFNIREKSDIII